VAGKKKGLVGPPSDKKGEGEDSIEEERGRGKTKDVLARTNVNLLKKESN